MDEKNMTFCKEYAAGFDAEEAIWMAKYLRNEAKAIAEQLLSLDEVQAAIENEKDRMKKEVDDMWKNACIP